MFLSVFPLERVANYTLLFVLAGANIEAIFGLTMNFLHFVGFIFLLFIKPLKTRGLEREVFFRFIRF